MLTKQWNEDFYGFDVDDKPNPMISTSEYHCGKPKNKPKPKTKKAGEADKIMTPEGVPLSFYGP